MKAVKIIVLILLILAGAGFGFYTYLGGFSTVTVTKADFKSTEIVFAIHKGAYKDLSKSWDKFKTDWEAAGIKECDSLGMYFDPPGTPDEKLRSVIACRIDGFSDAEKAKAKAKLPSFKMPASKSLYATFPFKNVMSFFVGPMRVYPEMKKIVDAEKLPAVGAIETYGKTSSIQTMGYYMPYETTRSDYQKLSDAFK